MAGIMGPDGVYTRELRHIDVGFEYGSKMYDKYSGSAWLGLQ